MLEIKLNDIQINQTTCTGLISIENGLCLCGITKILNIKEETIIFSGKAAIRSFIANGSRKQY